MIKSIALAVLATTCFATSLPAAGVLYECDIADHERARGWISPKIAIVLPGDETVKIVDAITLNFSKQPVAGTVLRNNANRLIVKWVVQDVKADNGTSFAGINYRASIGKSNGAIEVKTIPNGYDKGLRATGVCKARRQ